MSQESKTPEQYHPTNLEAMGAILNWVQAFNQEDFKMAFENSLRGWDHYWNLLRKKFEQNIERSDAIIQLILRDMDKMHLEMLCDYILNKRFKRRIIHQRKKTESETTIFQAIQLEYKIFHVFGSSENFDVAAKSDLAVKQKYPAMMVTPLIKTEKEDWDKRIEIVE